MTEKARIFDQAAAAYDTTFTYSEIGKLQRERVYFWLNHIHFFERVDSVFELNCGTGFDAEYFNQKGLKVTATDGSVEMIKTAEEKRNPDIDFFPMDFHKITENYKPSDAIFSNFGGLNCLDETELQNHLEKAAQLQLPGNLWIGVLMPRFCLMESLYFLGKFRFKAAFRRNTKKGLDVNVDGVLVTTYYHSPRKVKQFLKATHTVELVKPVALFLPPSYLETFMVKRPRLLRILSKLEALFGRFSLFSPYSDHFILIARKK